MRIEMYECDRCKRHFSPKAVVKIRLVLERESSTPGGPEGKYHNCDLCVECLEKRFGLIRSGTSLAQQLSELL